MNSRSQQTKNKFIYDSESNSIISFGASIPAVLTKKNLSQYTPYDKIMGSLNKSPENTLEILSGLESAMPASATFEILENIMNNIPYNCIDGGHIHNPSEEQRKIAKKTYDNLLIKYMARQPTIEGIAQKL